MLRFARWAGLAAAVAGCVGSEAAPGEAEPAVVELQGTLTAPRTLHRGHVYVVRGLLDLHADLTVQPGAVVKFGPNGDLWAHVGRVFAVGTDVEPIVFTSLADDTYGGDTNGDGAATAPLPEDSYTMETQADGSVLDHCRLLWGGSVSRGVLVVSGATVLRDSVIAHSSSYGVAVQVGRWGGGAGSVIASNVFFANGTPLALSASATVSGNVFHDPSSSPPYDGQTGNWPNQVELVPTEPYTDPSSAVFVGATSLSIGDVALVARGEVRVPSGSTFALADGTVLKMWPGSRISVGGADRLILGQGALVTALADEANGGHVLGMTGPPAAGSWLGVWSESDLAWISDPRFLYSAYSSP